MSTTSTQEPVTPSGEPATSSADPAAPISDATNDATTTTSLTRRTLLKRVGGIAAGATGAALVAACTPAAASWTYPPNPSPGAGGPSAPPSGTPAPTSSEEASTGLASPTPSGPAPSSPASSEPARPVTIKEISRHPSDLPPSADFTKYADGKYEGLTPRSGNTPLTHEVHLTTVEGIAEVVPGATMEYWTFDGQVPGPMIRARVDDSIDFYLTNDAKSLMPHNVDFHAVTGPGGGADHLDTLPGNESHLKVKLLNPGIYVYHCAFPDVPMHVAHGMYGMIVVEPKGGLPKVDREYYLLQSEFYTDRGSTLDYSQLKDAGHLPYSPEYANDERPTFVVWNGRPESIVGDRALGTLDDPIATGETVRMFVGNIGPNLLSSFHVIGEIFDTVYVEGSFALENHHVQSTLVPAGGAVGVEFKVQVPGTYTIVDHALSRLHKGIAGQLVVGGDPVPEIYEPIKSDDIRGATASH